MLTEIAIWGVFAAGYLYTYRRAYLVMTSVDGGDDDAEIRAMAAIICLIAGALWPIVVPAYIVWRIATPKTIGQREDELKARKAAADERDRKIAEHERRLGINQEKTSG